MADKEEIKTLEELEEKGRILREYKEKFRQMCQEMDGRSSGGGEGTLRN